MRGLFALFLMISTLFGSACVAHELRPAFLDIKEVAADTYDVTWKVPARGDYKLALYVRLPASCRENSEPAGSYVDLAFVSRWQAVCDGGLKGKSISIDGLPATYTDALMKVVSLDGTTQTSRLTPSAASALVESTPNVWMTARTYFFLGVEHILLGVDHLLFVFALLLLIGSPRTLLMTITSFTVAHSITLACATLGIVQVPQAPVEALIALSIMFVASEIIRSGRGAVHLSTRYPWVISFVFGLLHGFGFSGALREIGLPQKDIPMALLTFNLGVEAGQIAFVTVALLVMAGVKAILKDISRLETLLAYLIGSVSAFWVVQRIAGF